MSWTFCQWLMSWDLCSQAVRVSSQHLKLPNLEVHTGTLWQNRAWYEHHISQFRFHLFLASLKFNISRDVAFHPFVSGTQTLGWSCKLLVKLPELERLAHLRQLRHMRNIAQHSRLEKFHGSELVGLYCFFFEAKPKACDRLFRWNTVNSSTQDRSSLIRRKDFGWPNEFVISNSKFDRFDAFALVLARTKNR